MENVYNVLYRKIALEKWEMSVESEHLARQLVESGRFRIDANEKVNFVRFSYPAQNINIVFSYRELCDEKLSMRTKRILKRLLSRKYSGKALSAQVKKTFKKLHHDVTKIVGVDEKTEMRLARAIVQSSHPSVIILLLLEGAELFVSYSHSVGDMLDISSWQEVGDSSGLQSTGYRESSVLVSCGGNPFASEEEKHHSGDGFNALSRMVVIAGQELGHFADIMRDKKGRIIGRYSSKMGGARAKEPTKTGRLNDIKSTKRISQILIEFKLKEIAKLERRIKFFKKQKRKGLIVINTQRKINNMTRRFVRKCKKAKLDFLLTIPKDNDGHLAVPIEMMLSDMLFNLAPKADVYTRVNPLEEEAIACIEALARVPQQVNKWGHKATRKLMPNLYVIYYRDVIPGCIKTCEDLTGEKFYYKETKKNFVRKFFERFLSGSK